jgi:hypothetical protein
LAGMAGTGGGFRGGTGAETGLNPPFMDEERDVLGADGREEVGWAGGREDWSREVRRIDRRRAPSPDAAYEDGLVVEDRDEVEAPRTRGRAEPELDEDDGKAIPLADSAGEAGRGMPEGVVGREGIAVLVELDRL